MRLPKSFNSITVEQYQDCYFILKDLKPPTPEDPFSDIDPWVTVISILSGKTIEEVNELPRRELSARIRQLDFILRPEVLKEKPKKYLYSGRIYRAILRADQLNNAQAIDIRTFMKPQEGMSENDTVVLNAHKLLASIFLPLTWKGFKYDSKNHARRAADFKKAKMGDVYGTLFFYSILSMNLIKATEAYGLDQAKILQEHFREVEEWQKTLPPDGAGTIPSSRFQKATP